MIEVKLVGWEERELQNQIANKCLERIISSEFKLYGNVPEEGFYTPFVANLVADRIYNYMINNEEIKTRIDKAISNAEKTIVKQYMTRQ